MIKYVVDEKQVKTNEYLFRIWDVDDLADFLSCLYDYAQSHPGEVSVEEFKKWLQSER